ncbi:hypothetical protein ACOBQB_25120 [Streptomyces sp. G5(2025)]|uniref:hypothetical protein n=1 Tax=Streptomyces sp. G5(2025) TaxID=3406628 RepID=UPI003C17B83E
MPLQAVGDLWRRGLMSRIADYASVFRVPRGRHRAGRKVQQAPKNSPQVMPTARPCPPVAATVRCWHEPLDGAASRLIRPYLAACEDEEKARLQRLRRDTLWCATYGIDLDARNIHRALEVA